MTDKQLYKELERFANDHTLAKDIKVTIDLNSTSYKPREEGSYAKYEDVCLLADIVRGAEHYLMWKWRRK